MSACPVILGQAPSLPTARPKEIGHRRQSARSCVALAAEPAQVDPEVRNGKAAQPLLFPAQGKSEGLSAYMKRLCDVFDHDVPHGQMSVHLYGTIIL
jgi:hypothetical protein